MKLSEHFDSSELNVDGADIRIVNNAAALCQIILEPLRAEFGLPITITSGYRPPARNATAGGKPHSYHLYEGTHAAVDVKIPGIPAQEVFDWLRLKSELPWDKVILETSDGVPTIVHLQYDCSATPRRLAYVGMTGACEHYVPQEVS